MKLKSNLKNLLAERGLTIREFSRQIDYRFDTVRQLYHGTLLRIPVELIERSCEALDCDISDLLYVDAETEDA